MFLFMWLFLLMTGAQSRVLNPLEQNVTDDASISQITELLDNYVVAADFDNRLVAQINSNKTTGIVPTDLAFMNDAEPKIVHKNDVEEVGMTQAISADAASRRPDTDMLLPSVENMADDRGALIPHGVAPLIVSQRSVLAVGFITFLILLTSFQNTMVSMTALNRPSSAPTQTSLLGGLTQVLG